MRSFKYGYQKAARASHVTPSSLTDDKKELQQFSTHLGLVQNLIYCNFCKKITLKPDAMSIVDQGTRAIFASAVALPLARVGILYLGLDILAFRNSGIRDYT